MNRDKLNIKVRVKVYCEQESFGPGISELLVLVDKLGSIRKACSEMNMAYSKAWKIIKKAENDLGIEFVDSTSGGNGGGNSVLTPQGKDFLRRYLALQDECKKTSEELLHKHFENF